MQRQSEWCCKLWVLCTEVSSFGKEVKLEYFQGPPQVHILWLCNFLSYTQVKITYGYFLSPGTLNNSVLFNKVAHKLLVEIGEVFVAWAYRIRL